MDGVMKVESVGPRLEQTLGEMLVGVAERPREELRPTWAPPISKRKLFVRWELLEPSWRLILSAVSTTLSQRERRVPRLLVAD